MCICFSFEEYVIYAFVFFFSSRRRHTRLTCDWSSDVCSSDLQDALFLGILVANSGIGIGQELRAKRALDRLAALVAPTAHVLREGQARDVPVEGVVEGGLVRVQAGDQIIADGTLVDAAVLSLDE